MTATSIVWFRRDLRVEDNPALSAAAERGPVLPVYIHAPHEEEPWSAGAASRAWLHHSLTRHADRLRALGAPLSVFTGDSLKVLTRLIGESGAGALFYNRLYEPEIVARDKKIDAALKAQGVEVRSFKSALIFEPQEIENRSGKPFRVFTPFYRHCAARLPEAIGGRAPSSLAPP
ncbi:MAG: deoxyribodipyrimidine photo-lyase, partial [Gammaproteobacteria bacterium]|nr:deoxyribodipyrimidine photo-lyase [Gammaproteobacteria bacterium]